MLSLAKFRRLDVALVAPFLPSPLIELLGRQGFASKVEHGRGGSWMVHFWRENP